MAPPPRHHHRNEFVSGRPKGMKSASPGNSPCSWASGCCQRHPISCRDTSNLLLAPQPVAGQCVGSPVYTRPGRVGSKFTTQYLSDNGGQSCAQWGAFHDVVASSLPAHQNKVTVLREPCSRARSLLSHWHREFPPSHDIQRVQTLTQLAAYLRAHWEPITRRPWPEHDKRLHHFIVGWPQAWYVDNCTQVLCFEQVTDELSAYCTARRRGSLDGGSAFRKPATNSSRALAHDDAVACTKIRDIYAADTALHDRHCRRAAPGGQRRTLTKMASSSGALARVDDAPPTAAGQAPVGTTTGLPVVMAPPTTTPACDARVAMLLVGLAGSTVHTHMLATQSLQQQLSASVVAVGEASEATTSLSHLSMLGASLRAMGLVSETAVPRPPYLPQTTKFHSLIAPTRAPPSSAGGGVRRLATATAPPSATRRSVTHRVSAHHQTHQHAAQSPARGTDARAIGPRKGRTGSSRTASSRAGTGSSSSSSSSSIGVGKLRPGAKAQWHKYHLAWKLLEEVEASLEEGGGFTFDLVLKLRYDATPLLPFDPCGALAPTPAPVLYAATDKIFWGRRSVMAVAAKLHDAIEPSFERRAPPVEAASGLGTMPLGRLDLKRLHEAAVALPVSAWSTLREQRQHYNKVAMLPVPTRASAASAALDSLNAAPLASAAAVRAQTLERIGAALSSRTQFVAPYSTSAAASYATISSSPEGTAGLRLIPGARSSALDRSDGVFVAERDFLIWYLWHNITVCDLGARTTAILYKGSRAPRPSVACPTLSRGTTGGDDASSHAAATPSSGASTQWLWSPVSSPGVPSPAPGSKPSRVHIFHGTRADGKLRFMYAPIVQTLAVGFNVSGTAVRLGEVDVSERGAASFQRVMKSLGPGDTFIWVGMKQHSSPPWQQLRARGVRTIYYQTEPLAKGAGCILPPGRRPGAPPRPEQRLVDEVWEYSRWNIAQCQPRPFAPRLRHVPPGAYLDAHHVDGRDASGRGSGGGRGGGVAEAVFLGDPTLEERAKCFLPLRALVTPVNDAWSHEAIERVVGPALGAANAPRIVVNLHKRCMQDERSQPMEAVRVAQVLSLGALLVSQHAAPEDEELYHGLVDFCSLAELPQTIAALLRRTDLPALAAQRAAEFRRRFQPRQLVAEGAPT